MSAAAWTPTGGVDHTVLAAWRALAGCPASCVAHIVFHSCVRTLCGTPQRSCRALHPCILACMLACLLACLQQSHRAAAVLLPIYLAVRSCAPHSIDAHLPPSLRPCNPQTSAACSCLLSLRRALLPRCPLCLRLCTALRCAVPFCCALRCAVLRCAAPPQCCSTCTCLEWATATDSACE